MLCSSHPGALCRGPQPGVAALAIQVHPWELVRCSLQCEGQVLDLRVAAQDGAVIYFVIPCLGMFISSCFECRFSKALI